MLECSWLQSRGCSGRSFPPHWSPWPPSHRTVSKHKTGLTFTVRPAAWERTFWHSTSFNLWIPPSWLISSRNGKTVSTEFTSFSSSPSVSLLLLLSKAPRLNKTSNLPARLSYWLHIRPTQPEPTGEERPWRGPEPPRGGPGAETSSERLRRPLGAPRDQTNLKDFRVTYEFITIRFGGMAARKRPMGRKAASAFRKSLKLSFPLKHVL